MMATIKLTGISIDVVAFVLDTEEGTEAVPSISITHMPDWLYTSEALRLCRHIARIAKKTDACAKKRTAVLKARKKKRR